MTANWFPYLLFPAHMVQGLVRTHTRESGGEGRRTCRRLWVNCVFTRIDFWKCSWAHAVISSRESWFLIQLVDDIDLLCRCWNLHKKVAVLHWGTFSEKWCHQIKTSRYYLQHSKISCFHPMCCSSGNCICKFFWFYLPFPQCPNLFWNGGYYMFSLNFYANTLLLKWKFHAG